MTRGVVTVPEPRNVMVAVKCSEGERADIRREAAARGMTVSGYLREAHERMASERPKRKRRAGS